MAAPLTLRMIFGQNTKPQRRNNCKDRRQSKPEVATKPQYVGGSVDIRITQNYTAEKDTIQLQAELENPVNSEWTPRGGFSKKVIKTKVGKFTNGVKESEQLAELLSLVSDFLVKEAKKVEKSGENSIFE